MVGYMVELVDEWQEMDDRKKTALEMDLACADGRIGRAVDRIWKSQFGWYCTTNKDCFISRRIILGVPRIIILGLPVKRIYTEKEHVH